MTSGDSPAVAVPAGRLPGFDTYTSGDRFNPNDPYVYFLASVPGQHVQYDRVEPEKRPHRYEHVLMAVNDMDGPAALSILDRCVDDGRSVLMDSGIFNLTMSHARAHNMAMDDALLLAPDEVDGFPQLYERYCSIASRYGEQLWGMIELDLGGPKVKPETRQRIIADTGMTPIPVVHPRLDGWDYYDQHADAYDRICVGNLVQASVPDRARLLHALSVRSREQHPNTWHHLLGVTPSPLIYAAPVHGSSDSSSWLNSVRWLASWYSGAMATTFARMPTDYWYRPAKHHPDGHSTDAHAITSSVIAAEALTLNSRQIRDAYGSSR